MAGPEYDIYLKSPIRESVSDFLFVLETAIQERDNGNALVHWRTFAMFDQVEKWRRAYSMAMDFAVHLPGPEYDREIVEKGLDLDQESLEYTLDVALDVFCQHMNSRFGN